MQPSKHQMQPSEDLQLAVVVAGNGGERLKDGTAILVPEADLNLDIHRDVGPLVVFAFALLVDETEEAHIIPNANALGGGKKVVQAFGPLTGNAPDVHSLPILGGDGPAVILIGFWSEDVEDA